MNTRQLHHLWTLARPIRPRYFLIAAVLCGVVCIVALRANNLHMGKLREAVYQADQNNGDVQSALTNLQRYVTSHMNAGLSGGHNSVYPPIQLKYTYERLKASSVSAQSNSELYTEAQAYCQQQNPTDFSGRNRVPCIEQYVLSHGSGKSTPIPDSLYKFDFRAPLWSPDLAGWSLVLSVLFLLITISVWQVDRWFKRRVE